MIDFSFEQNFYRHFKYLRENIEMFVSFNIDRCSHILDDKITMSLYYNNKLDVEDGKSWLDKFAAQCNLNERGWQSPCKLPLVFLIFTMRTFFLVENLLALQPLNIDDRFTRL